MTHTKSLLWLPEYALAELYLAPREESPFIGALFGRIKPIPSQNHMDQSLKHHQSHINK